MGYKSQPVKLRIEIYNVFIRQTLQVYEWFCEISGRERGRESDRERDREGRKVWESEGDIRRERESLKEKESEREREIGLEKKREAERRT